MTGSQTDPVRIPPYETAVSLILHLAGPLFNHGMALTAGSPKADANFSAYKFLRGLAGRMVLSCSVRLTEDDYAALGEACGYVHAIAHEAEDSWPPRIIRCTCPAAVKILSLAAILIANEARFMEEDRGGSAAQGAQRADMVFSRFASRFNGDPPSFDLSSDVYPSDARALLRLAGHMQVRM